ncbi:hypothetical protein ACET8U_22590 [Aeromonas veronii]
MNVNPISTTFGHYEKIDEIDNYFANDAPPFNQPVFALGLRN